MDVFLFHQRAYLEKEFDTSLCFGFSEVHVKSETLYMRRLFLIYA